ncbi:MAG TPA: hypothetical protein VMM54_06375 [Nitrospirota bacterium]|nr:hypothetical protein [Nitrospirota bacterium]
MKRAPMIGFVVVFLLASVIDAGAQWDGYGAGTNVETMKKFQKETLALRDELMTKNLELRNEYSKSVPDTGRIATLRKEIIDLETKIQNIADKYNMTSYGRMGGMMGSGMMGGGMDCPMMGGTGGGMIGGMGGGMMGGMGGGMMGGMGGMGSGMMGGMGGGVTGGMSHNMEQGLGMKDLMQIMTMQDMLQIMTEMLKIQEQMAEETKGAKGSRLKGDIEELRGRTKQAITDLKGFVAEQPR